MKDLWIMSVLGLMLVVLILIRFRREWKITKGFKGKAKLVWSYSGEFVLLIALTYFALR